MQSKPQDSNSRPSEQLSSQRREIKRRQGRGKGESGVCFRWECELTTEEDSKEGPTPRWSRNSTPGYLSKENENDTFKIYMHPTYNSPRMAVGVCPSTDERIKMGSIDTEYYAAMREGEIRPRVHPDGRAQPALRDVSQRKTHTSCFHLREICIWKQMNHRKILMESE